MHNSHDIMVQVMWENYFEAHVAHGQNGHLTFVETSILQLLLIIFQFLKWNLNKYFQELEFTGVMRFYYQAQDMDSGQKVGLFS